MQQQFEKLKEVDDHIASTGNSPSWVTIDATRSIEEVHAEVLQAVERILPLVAETPIRRLWQPNEDP